MRVQRRENVPENVNHYITRSIKIPTYTGDITPLSWDLHTYGLTGTFFTGGLI